MCCVGECIIKYVLIIGNVLFAILGLVVLGLGIAAHIQLNEITELVPVNLSLISISIMVLGSLVFVLAFLACCGAIVKSICMLVCYAISMAILAGLKIYLTVVMFRFVNDAQSTVAGWLNDAFANPDVRRAFLLMETFFECCGTEGASSYVNTNATIPSSCCPTPIDNTCNVENSYGGCNDIVGSWFDTFGGAVGGLLIAVIIFELVCMIFSLNVVCSIRNRKRRA